eukprot:TRINITY_DN618_c0_g1_i5.p1 TRINITY_DN618_c0_g1~~TRINITY_DN618_c0_g1_i5.p1  ORF type:complete len:319 (-),score=84.73 TRINITY_DN618_c0_g1_i5:93-1049(-)
MSHHGSIRFIVDKPYYMGGEQVTGRVEITINHHVHEARAVMVKWKGFERTMVENTVTRQGADGNPVTEVQKFKDEKTFFKDEVMLFSFQGRGLAEGVHTFPFQYNLPPTLPGVFYDERREHDGDKIKGAIVYKVKCWLDMPGKDIKRTEKIIISEAVTRMPTPIHESNKKSFMFAKGDLKMEVDLPKNVYVPGETLPVHVRVNNESSKKVDALKVKLMRKVIIRAKHFTKEHVHEVHRAKYAGVDKKTDKVETLVFTLANDVYPSTEGHLVRCQYHLDVECDVANAFDLEVHPKITIALMPAPGAPVALYHNYSSHAW